MNALVYDLEIVKAIPSPREDIVPGIEYCSGWSDHANMGISCICCYDYVTERYRVFLEDSFQEFIQLCNERAMLVSFNGLGFDAKVLNATCAPVVVGHQEKEYDICREMRIADGKHPEMPVRGISLDKSAKANLGYSKTGSGGLAPILWQQGKKGQVIDYCLQDVNITKSLFDKILREGCLTDPRDPMETLLVRQVDMSLLGV